MGDLRHPRFHTVVPSGRSETGRTGRNTPAWVGPEGVGGNLTPWDPPPSFPLTFTTDLNSGRGVGGGTPSSTPDSQWGGGGVG